MNNNIKIRPEKKEEQRQVEELVRESFWNVYRPGCMEGNIDFYGKSGFRPASQFGIRYHGVPEGEDASFFLCKELIPGYFDGITGEYATPKGYFVDEAEVEEFDLTFPYKEKKILPGQLF